MKVLFSVWRDTSYCDRGEHCTSEFRTPDTKILREYGNDIHILSKSAIVVHHSHDRVLPRNKPRQVPGISPDETYRSAFRIPMTPALYKYQEIFLRGKQISICTSPFARNDAYF